MRMVLVNVCVTLVFQQDTSARPSTTTATIHTHWWLSVFVPVPTSLQVALRASAAVCIQCACRMHIATRRSVRSRALHSVQLRLSALLRGAWARHECRRRVRLIVRAQAGVRRWLWRRAWARYRLAGARLAACWRRGRARRVHLTLLTAAVAVQSAWRGRTGRGEAWIRRAGGRISRWWRSAGSNRRLERWRLAVHAMQTAQVKVR
jgi:hypothetical protein